MSENGTDEAPAVPLRQAFARRLPEGRRFGVVAGTGRILEALQRGEVEVRSLQDWAAR